MPICSHESSLMVTSTPLASWFAAINRLYVAFCDNSRARMSDWLMISPRKHSFVLTRISETSVARRSFPPGFIESLTMCFATKPVSERNLSGSMRPNGNRRPIRKQRTRDYVTIL